MDQRRIRDSAPAHPLVPDDDGIDGEQRCSLVIPTLAQPLFGRYGRRRWARPCQGPSLRSSVRLGRRGLPTGRMRPSLVGEPEQLLLAGVDRVAADAWLGLKAPTWALMCSTQRRGSACSASLAFRSPGRCPRSRAAARPPWLTICCAAQRRAPRDWTPDSAHQVTQRWPARSAWRGIPPAGSDRSCSRTPTTAVAPHPPLGGGYDVFSQPIVHARH